MEFILSLIHDILFFVFVYKIITNVCLVNTNSSNYVVNLFLLAIWKSYC